MDNEKKNDKAVPGFANDGINPSPPKAYSRPVPPPNPPKKS